MKTLGKVFKWIYLVLTLVFLYAPIFVLIVFSFTESRTMSKWNGFSLNAYREMLSDAALMDALKVIDEEEITMYMINPKAPCFIRNMEETYVYLILPVNFN